MTLRPGTKLGPYEISAALGAGGMGEVYRARDSRLGRDVAIKVLPAHLTENPELRARFEREARTISSLNHPHICTLFDVGREGAADYLVMELVEGPTLADRIAKGALPADEALRIGMQIADALDRAHRAGIIHRDLKPGNVMLTKSGAKLMDFGLARAAAIAAAPGSGTQSPTLTRPLTSEGSIVGTFQYMAPEQLDGGEADARADLWALGATLYEMVTGKKAFQGRSQASLIASILKEQPEPISAAQPLTPPALDQLIRACLAKDPDERIQTAHDVKLQLQWIAEGGSRAGVAAPVAARRRSREGLAWIVAGAGLLAAVVLGALLVARRPAPAQVTRFEVLAPAAAPNVSWPRMSPDGRTLAFIAADTTGLTRIWVRPLSVLQARPLMGTENAGRPFWSPDSRFLGFVTEGKLRKVPVDGGPPVTIADAPGRYDGTWGRAGWILLDGSVSDSIGAVRADGGTMRFITSPDRAAGENGHAWPFMLPDGKHYLCTVGKGASIEAEVHVGEIGARKTRKVAVTDGRVEFANGYLMISRDGTLLAQPFDLGRLETVGDPVPVGEDILSSNSGSFSTSNDALAYLTAATRMQGQLTWMDRSGKVLGTIGPPGEYRDIALSPDGQRVAIVTLDEGARTEDVWVRQIAQGVSTRLTFDPGTDMSPVWSPDGQRIAFTSNRSGLFHTYVIRGDGAGVPDSVIGNADQNGGPVDWSPSQGLLLRCISGTTNWDLWRHPMTRPDAPLVKVMQSPRADLYGMFSPDGRWVAVQSSISGRNEVYVQPADGSSGNWQVSAAGGGTPYWRADGRELYFESPDRTIMAVPISTESGFVAGAPVPLFKANWVTAGYAARRWQPTPDGQRFLVNLALSSPGRRSFTVVTNWASELRKK